MFGPTVINTSCQYQVTKGDRQTTVGKSEDPAELPSGAGDT